MSKPTDFFKEVYDVNYHAGLAHRSYSMRFSLTLFMYNKGYSILETGTTRYSEHFGDGQFTRIVGSLGNYYECKVDSVDIDPVRVDFARSYLAEYKNLAIHNQDSIEFIKNYNSPIDYLYLDSLDCPTGDNDDASASQTHNLNELKAAEINLHDKSIIVIDDARLVNGGKAKMTNEYLLDKGWFNIPFEYQNVYIKI